MTSTLENPMYLASPPDFDEPTVESLSEQVETLTGKVSTLMQFVHEQFDACGCEHCGHVHPRKQMLAVFGLDMGTDGKAHPESSRWFCGYCVYAASVNLGANRQEYRDKVGKWLACGYGRQFLRGLDSYYLHLGPGANESPVARQFRREFAEEMKLAARRGSR